MRIAVSVTLPVLILVASSLGSQASRQESRNDRERFVTRLLVGVAENGTVYVELRLQARYFASAKVAKERWAVWDAFFTRVLHERPENQRLERAPYWSDFRYNKVDWPSVAGAVDVRVGDVLRVRTPIAEVSAKVVKYAIHYNAPGDSNLLLAEAQPLANVKLVDSDFLIAAPGLPGCGSLSSASTVEEPRRLAGARPIRMFV